MKMGKIIIIITILAVIAAYLAYPNLWWLSISLGLWIAFLQVIAISNIKGKHTFFKYTDYAYYLIIGLVVFISTKNISGEMFEYLDTLEGKDSIKKDIEVLKIKEKYFNVLDKNQLEISNSSIEGEETDPIITEDPEKQENTPPNQKSGDNKTYSLDVQSSKYAKNHKKISDSIDSFINDYEKTEIGVGSENMVRYYLEWKLFHRDNNGVIKIEIARLENKLNFLNTKDSIFSIKDTLEEELLFITALFIFGLAIKVGKTTCSLQKEHH